MSQEMLTMVDYNKLLKDAKNKKWELIQEQQTNLHECNYSEGDGCVACTHPSRCIFDKKVIEYENQLTLLKLKEKDLQDYIKTGKGTYGYDREKLLIELYKVKKEIKELKK